MDVIRMQLEKRYTYSGCHEAMPFEDYLISRFAQILDDGGISRDDSASLPNEEDGKGLYIPKPFSPKASELLTWELPGNRANKMSESQRSDWERSEFEKFQEMEPINPSDDPHCEEILSDTSPSCAHCGELAIRERRNSQGEWIPLCGDMECLRLEWSRDRG